MEIMVRMKVLSLCKLDIYQILNFMFKIKINTAHVISKANLRIFGINIQLDLV